MDFQKLTIHNIASIEYAVIDFEAQPLVDSDVYLITGKTGAGKSTILDAICLALYADTPRLNSTNMQGETADTDNKTVKIDDPRQLMRRNTGEASVSLTFVGSNGVHYEAVWAVARSRKKVNGTIQPKTWELTNLDTGKTITKDAEIKREISAAIGLDFNQFCRTTMLAQGEFTRFLNSKDEEKAAILEKITGVSVYSKIGKKIFEVYSQKKQVWEDAQRLVEGTRTLSDDEIKEKNDKIQEIAEQTEEFLKTQNAANAKLLWIKTATELTTKMTTAEEAHKKAVDAVNADDFKAKEQLIKDWNATIDARNWLTEQNKATEQKSSMVEGITMLSRQFGDILGGQQYAINELKKLEESKIRVDKYIEENKAKSSIYANAQTIVGHLNTIADGRKSIDDSAVEVDKDRKDLTDVLLPALTKASEEANTAKSELKGLDVSVESMEKELEARNLPTLRTQRDDVKTLLTNIETAKDRIETLNEDKQKTQHRREQLEEQKKKLDEKQKMAEEMAPQIHDAELKMKVSKESLDKQSDTINKFAKTLRAKLQVGDVCPVCQQKIEAELPHESELTAMVSGLQDAYDNAKKEYDDQVKVKTRYDAEINSATESYNRELKALNEDKSVAIAEQKAIAACKVCGVNIQELETLEIGILELETLKLETLNLELNEKIKSAEELETKVKTLRTSLDKQRKQTEKAEKKARDAEQAVKDCNARIEKTQSLINARKVDVAKAENEVKKLLADVTWELDWSEQPKEFGVALTDAADEYKAKVEQQKDLAGDIKSMTTDVNNVADVVNTIIDAMPDWKDVKASGIHEVKNLLTKANDLNQKLTTTQTKLNAAEESIKTNGKKLEVFLSENNDLDKDRLTVLTAYNVSEINVMTQSLKVGKENVIARQTEANVAKKYLAEHNDKKPELNVADTVEALSANVESLGKQIRELGEQKGAINNELATNEENKQKLGALIKDADDKKAVYDKWSRMNQFIGDATGNKFRKIAQSYILTSLIHAANSYMNTLTDRYTLKVKPGTFVISIEDAYQGYVSRAASTISGGESFLVSLSLALALSDIGETLQVDTLFIDEGFGTLSGEPLQKAIETLRSLHTKAGRHVGIISHVEELQERIPVQIQVNQEGNNSSSKVKIIPEVI